MCKKITVILAIFTISLCYSQKDEFYSEDIISNGDTTMILTRCVNNTHYFYESTCRPMYDRWNWLKYSENPDSITKLVHDKIAPYLGQDATNRTVVSMINSFNSKNTISDLSPEEKKDYDPKCLKVGWTYKCFVRLRDSIWFPFAITLDTNSRIIDSGGLPKYLKNNKDGYDVLPFSKVYKIAINDPWMKEVGVRDYIYLKYSNEMGIFYYKLKAQNGKLIVGNKNSPHTETEYKYIYIHAHTGKVLWRITGLVTIDSNGCTITEFEDIPFSPLTR